MNETLSDAIDALDSSERGFYFYSSGTAVSQLLFGELCDAVHSLAKKINALGQRRGDPIIIVFNDQSQFVQTFLAVIRAGLVAVPLHPPALAEDIESYHGDIQRLRRITGARYLLTDDCLYARLQPVDAGTGLISWSECLSLEPRGWLAAASPSDPALIQFTSGSTSLPKGVEISHRNLVSNALAIRQALQIDPARDSGVSWLPLHHDMGLVGFLVTPVLTQVSNRFLSPLEFARHPRRWLELISRTRATISYAPNFGYHHACRSLRDSDGEQWDLSAWRVAGCGGEPVIDSVLAHFAARLQAAGFDREAFLPSYGLAEATVAVTISPLQRGITTRTVAPSMTSSLSSASTDCTRSMISSGKPVTQTEVRLVSADGQVLDSTAEGEIQVRGPGVARRYWREGGHESATDGNGWLSTGDRGRLIDGELHVCGRIKENILINGRNLYPHDIEECVGAVDGVRRGRVAAFGRPGAGSEQLVLVAEASQVDDADRFCRALRQSVRENLGISLADVVLVDRGCIMRTSSGKIRRRALRQRYLSGELANDLPRRESRRAPSSTPPVLRWSV